MMTHDYMAKEIGFPDGLAIIYNSIMVVCHQKVAKANKMKTRISFTRHLTLVFLSCILSFNSCGCHHDVYYDVMLRLLCCRDYGGTM